MPQDAVSALAEELRSGVEALAIPHKNSQLGTVTVSIGVAEVSAGIPYEILISRADGALYAAKSRGWNTVSLYE